MKVSCLNKRANGSDKAWRCLCTDAFGFTKEIELIQFFMQFLFIKRNDDTTLFSETFCGRNLMVIALLAQICLPRHNYDPLSKFKSCDD